MMQMYSNMIWMGLIVVIVTVMMVGLVKSNDSKWLQTWSQGLLMEHDDTDDTEERYWRHKLHLH